MLYQGRAEVSVPIRGLFNLTETLSKEQRPKRGTTVSVPIRGLFNLTAR